MRIENQKVTSGFCCAYHFVNFLVVDPCVAGFIAALEVVDCAKLCFARIDEANHYAIDLFYQWLICLIEVHACTNGFHALSFG
ncbi:hypothetical protein D3C84_1129610 [compost metagenome]